MKTVAKASVALLVAGLSTFGIGEVANAGSLTYSNFSNPSNLQLNSSARTTLNANGQSVLRLTDGLGQSGSAFVTNPLSLANDVSFSSAFQFQMTNPMGMWDSDGQGADGLMFVVQTVSNTAGGSGGGIGYQGISNSLGIEFDTWNNGYGDGYNGNHVGINLNGSVNSVSRRNVTPRMNNGSIWSAWVDYNGATDLLEVRLSEGGARPVDAFLSHTVDLVSILGSTNAFFGFTSGTGGAGNTHDILAWQLSDSYNPIYEIEDVPEPSAMLGLLIVGGLSVRARRLRKRENLC